MSQILAKIADAVTSDLPAYLKALPVPKSTDDLLSMDAEQVRLFSIVEEGGLTSLSPACPIALALFKMVV